MEIHVSGFGCLKWEKGDTKWSNDTPKIKWQSQGASCQLFKKPTNSKNPFIQETQYFPGCYTSFSAWKPSIQKHTAQSGLGYGVLSRTIGVACLSMEPASWKWMTTHCGTNKSCWKSLVGQTFIHPNPYCRPKTLPFSQNCKFLDGKQIAILKEMKTQF